MPIAQKILFTLLITLMFAACSGEPQDSPPAPPTPTPAVEAATEDTATPAPPTPTSEVATVNEEVNEPAAPTPTPLLATMTPTAILSIPAAMTETTVLTTPIATTGAVTVTNTELTPAPSTSEPVEVQLDQPFSLNVGQSGQLAEANLSLTFQEVREDSRCPSQVTCVWAGQAIVAIAVQQEGSDSEILELNNNPPLEQDSATYQGYVIRFTGLDPYPQHPDQPIPPEAYQVTLVVSEQ